MPSLVEQYTGELHEKFRYWATWLPSSEIALGDCGPVTGRKFEPETSLEELGIAPEVLRGPQQIELQHRSSDGVTYTIQSAAGSQVIPGVPQGSAGIDIAFERGEAIVFVLRGGREERIANIRELKDALLERVLAGDLPRDYAIVTHVVRATSATILIGGSRGARFVASASADLQAGLMDLANVNVGLSRVVAEHLETELVARRRLTPLFKVVGFKKGGLFWGSPKIVSLGFDDDGDPGDLSELEPADVDADGAGP